ncbi:FecR domain-containing protein [Pigmentiphaga soli]|uniref:FecR domain-containing protein n=1 Tax=Pigmentiphaga soli TaxID=1007095 RepID=A0ABP8GFN9_9BURK
MAFDPMAYSGLPGPLAEAAVDWMVRLESGSATAQERAAFEAWLAADGAHRAAWERLQDALGPAASRLRALDRRARGQAAAAREALVACPPLSAQRRKLLGGAAAVLGLGAGACAVDRWVPLADLLADARSNTGQRKTVDLEDGSRLTLDARSAADVRFDARARSVRLLDGALAIEAAADSRPLEVRAGSLRAFARAGRFMIRQAADGRTLVAALRQDVRVQAGAAGHATLPAGQALWLADGALRPAPAPAEAHAAWLEGLVDVRDGTLGDVIEALRPYRHGLLQIAQDAARLPVFGVFSLDDGDRALRTLADTLPVTVRRFGPWLTRIALA